MYDVDVNGTHNVLEAAADAGTAHALVTSSVVAYGALPDNPDLLTEDDPVRGVPTYNYALHKTESDRVCQLWAAKHPDRTMTIVRPCIVLGPNVDNSLVRVWTKAPAFFDVGNLDNRVQFVHEDDVVTAITHLLDGRHDGAYNVAGDGFMTTGSAPSDRPADQEAAAARAAGPGEDDVEAAPGRGAGRPDRVRPPPLGDVEREAEGDWLDPAALVARGLRDRHAGHGRLDGRVMGRTGLEPVTSSLSSWRSPN